MLEMLKEFASKKIELLKMEATEKTVTTIGTVVFVAVLFLVFLFFILLLNIGLGLLIGYYLENYAYGILIMSGIYLLLMIIILASKKAIKSRVANMIVKSFYS